MKRTQSTLHRTGTYDVCKISMFFLMIKDTYYMMALMV